MAALFFFISTTLQLAAQCNNTTVLTVSNGSTGTWQNTTGQNVTVRITAVGAGGGSGLVGLPGGSGATQVGTFVVQNNQTIYAVAGASGQNATLVAGGGGGGASGAINQTTGTVLLIAGGGGGGGGIGLLAVGEGGFRSSSPCSGSGSGGNGNNGGGGGGYSSNGGDGSGATSGKKYNVSPYANGGTGAVNALNVGGNGGRGIVGGGGGGLTGGGGGAGFTGGAGGRTLEATASGGGGNSCNSSSNQGPGDTNGTNGGGNNSGSVTVLCLGVAPIELLSFKAQSSRSGAVELLWETASEVNNAGFNIEHSTDITHWESIGFVSGQGNSLQKTAYRFADPQARFGLHYYRLVQTDFDGRFEFSPIATVQSGGPRGLIFPNPSFGKEVYLQLTDLPADDYTLDIFTALGTLAWHQSVSTDHDDHLLTLHLNDLPAGTYRLVLSGRQQVLTESLLLR